jgi:threonine dehydratase
MATLRNPEGAVTAEDIERAAQLISGDVRETPILPANELSRSVGGSVVMKAECLQLTGSFKVRGAFHLMSGLRSEEFRAGMMAASSGNHAQAVALAASRRDSHADLFMPAESPLAKISAVRGYGGKVHLVAGSYDDAAEAARDFAAAEGGTLIPPFDDPRIVAGQGTVGLEIARQAPRTRLVVVPLGGGGLASGVAIAVKAKLSGVRVVGVQAEACSPYVGSVGARSVNTICDGIAIKRPGELTRPLVERYVDEIVTVSDDEVAQAMILLLERSKLVVEGAGAVGVAALRAGKIEPAAEGDTCAVLSGGNVDASRLAECIRLGETAARRRLVIWAVVPDRPGALAALLRIVAEHGASVLDVEHIREGVKLHVREAAVALVLQTDGPRHGELILEAIRAEGFSARPED